MQEVRGVRIENLYWMLAYAWGEFEAARSLAVSLGQTDAPLAPFAACFVNGTERIVRQGFYQSFVPRLELLSTVRGRILAAPTLRDGADRRGRIWCEFDHLSVDVLPNQIIRTALRRIDQSCQLDHNIRSRARALDRRFDGVRILQNVPRDFSVVGANAQKRGYRFLLSLARFILTDLKPIGLHGHGQFAEVEVEKIIHDVFERFVRNFLNAHQTRYSVRRTRRSWSDAYPKNEQARSLLPAMETDVVLTEPGRTIVIDTKFYQSTLRENRGVERARESHLYQMMGYLHNMKRSGEFEGSIEGLLLYPVAQSRVDACWMIHEFPVRLLTIDLSQPWEIVSKDLLAIANEGGLGPDFSDQVDR